MAFEWSEDIDKSDTCDAADLEEIRTNVDSIKDALANTTHNSGVDGTDDIGYDGSYDTGVDDDDNTGYELNDNGTYRDHVKGTDDTDEDTTVLTNEHVSVKATYELDALISDWITFHQPYKGTVEDTNNTVDNSTYNDSVQDGLQ